jgi:hypothetical protein
MLVLFEKIKTLYGAQCDKFLVVAVGIPQMEISLIYKDTVNNAPKK